MFKKLFFSSSRSITSAALLLSAAGFLSRILGLFRARIFANLFGAGKELDIYYAAFRIPDLILTIIIMGAVSSAFIPIFTEAHLKSKKNKKASDVWFLANNVLHVFSFFVLLFSLFLAIFAPSLIKIIAPGFDADAQAITITLTRIMLIQPVILALSSIFAGILQSFNVFFAYAISPLMYNLGIILGSLFFVPRLGIQGLAWGVVLGAFLHLIIQLPSLPATGYRYILSFNLKDRLMKKILKLTIPRSLALATLQLNTIAITAIASTLSAGSISIFNYANDIQYVPIGVIGISFAAAAFPALSLAFAKKEKNVFSKKLNKTIRETLYFTIPIALLCFFLRREIIGVILETGRFGKQETAITAATLAFFCLGIPFSTLVPLLSRAFFALHNTWIPLLINSIGVGLNISLNLFLIQKSSFFAFTKIDSDLRILALPLAFSLTNIFNVLALFWALKRKLPEWNLKKIIFPLIKIIIASAGLSLIIILLLPKFYQCFNLESIFHQLITIMLIGLSGGLVYLLLSYFLKAPELKSIFRVFFAIKK